VSSFSLEPFRSRRSSSRRSSDSENLRPRDVKRSVLCILASEVRLLTLPDSLFPFSHLELSLSPLCCSLFRHDLLRSFPWGGGNGCKEARRFFFDDAQYIVSVSSSLLCLLSSPRSPPSAPSARCFPHRKKLSPYSLARKLRGRRPLPQLRSRVTSWTLIFFLRLRDG